MLYNVALRVQFIGDLSELEKLLDLVMEELVKLDVTDPSIGGTLQDGDIEFTLAVEADTLEKATASVFGTIRAAIHAAGGGTPGWPEYRGESVRAQLVDA